MSKIAVLLVRPGEYPEMVEIEDSLESMQRTVGGYIEEYCPFADDCMIVCDEEGKLKSKPMNRAIYINGEIVDVVFGDFFVAYAPEYSDSLLSLPEEMALTYMERFRHPEEFYITNGKVEVAPY